MYVFISRKKEIFYAAKRNISRFIVDTENEHEERKTNIFLKIGLLSLVIGSKTHLPLFGLL